MLPLLPALAVLNFNYDLIVSVLIVRVFTVKTNLQPNTGTLRKQFLSNASEIFESGHRWFSTGVSLIQNVTADLLF